MHADRRRGRDVPHHRASPRGGARRRDRPGTLAVRPLEGPPVEDPARLGRRQPRVCLLVGRQAGGRAADHPRDLGRPTVLGRRRDRQARPRIRRGGNPRPPQGPRPPGVPPLLWPDFRAGPLEGHDHSRGLERRGAGPRRAGGRPGVRGPHRRGGLAIPHRAEAGRVRQRDLGGRLVEGPGRGERLGRAERGRRARPGVRRARLGGVRLPRGRPPRRQPVRQLHDRPRRRDRPAGLALPDAPPRPLGPRPADLSQPRHRHARRQARRRRGPGDEDRLRLPVRSDDGHAPVRDERPARAGLRRPRRAGLGDAAHPGQAAAVRRPVARRVERDRRRPEQSRVGPGEAGEDPRRAGLQPAEHGRDGGDPRLSRRRELVGRLVRPDDGPALRQLEQRAEHHHAGRVEAGRPGQQRAVRPRGVRPVPRQGGLSRHQAALGSPDRDRPRHRRVRLAGPPGRAPRTDRPGHPAHRDRELRRLDRDRRRPGLHRRDQGRAVPRLRQEVRATALGARPPGGGYATPSTYRANGRQYVVIAAGGAGKLRTKPGDAFVAFSVPD